MSLEREVDSLARSRYGISGRALIAKLEKGESGGRGNAVSSAGARGWFQFMPGTRRAVMQYTNGKVDPWRSRAEARKAAMIHLAGKLGHKKGLEGYNPGGGRGYVNYILKQKVGDVGGSRGLSRGKGRQGTPGTPDRLTVNFGKGHERVKERSEEDVTGAIMDTLLSRSSRPGKQPSLLGDIQRRLDSGAYTTTIREVDKAPGAARLGIIPGRKGTSGSSSSSRGGGSLRPGGGWGGTARPIEYLSRQMHSSGLRTTSGKRGTRNTASGGVSDHYIGNKNANARDWGGSVPQMDRAAVRLARLLGIKGYKKGQTLNRSVTINGVRYQVLYRTNVGGNHYDHIHVGAKRVG